MIFITPIYIRNSLCTFLLGLIGAFWGNTAWAQDATYANLDAQTHGNEPISVFGDLTNDGLFVSNLGRIYFHGNTRQHVSGQEIMDFEFITLNNSSHLELETTLLVTRQFQFENGLVHTPYDFTLLNAPPPVSLEFGRNATYLNAADTRHVRGYATILTRDSFQFPIGDGRAWRSAMVSPFLTTPGAATFSAAYYNDNLTANGMDTAAHGRTLTKISNAECWDIDGNVEAKITLTWNAASNLAQLIGTQLNDLVVVGWNGMEWVNLGNTGIAGNISEGRICSKRVIPSGYQAFTFAKGQICTEMDLLVMLEGALDTTQMKMTTALNQRGLLPGQTPIGMFATPTPAGQPYNRAPWNYGGAEGTVTYDSTVVDWVLVSLRADTTATTPVWQSAALLHRDGKVTFTTPCTTVPQDRPYYLLVEHRNHVGVMTAKPVAIVNDTLRFDFTRAEGYVLTDPPSTGQKKRGGRWVMMAGDGKKDTRFDNFDVNFNDKIVWRNQNGNFDVYRTADFNLDADVNFLDVILWRLNTGRHSAVPHQ